MAERRMFAKTIIDSDAFLDMPLSTQALYFHLSMRADDEGFLNNPKKISKIVGASEDDMKVLLAKKFILSFESGIIVIKHWKIHNYIRGDRLVETNYTHEKALLSLKENGAYSFIEGELVQLDIPADEKRKNAYANSYLPYSFEYKIKSVFSGKPCPVCGCKMQVNEFGIKDKIPTIQHCIPISKGGEHELGNIAVICRSCNASIRNKETGKLNSNEVIEVWEQIVSHTSVKCQHSIGQDSIDKVSIVQNNIPLLPVSDETEEFLKFYNDTVKNLPKAQKLSDKRKKQIKLRLKEEKELNKWKTAFENCDNSTFASKSNWCNFDWFIQNDTNWIKAYEGKYNDKTSSLRRDTDNGWEI